MGEQDKKIFCVFHDPIHYAEHLVDDPKGVHIHLFNSRFETDGSQQLIESDLSYALKEFILNLPEEGSGFQRMDDAPPYTYCMNDENGFMDSFFIIWFVTSKLQKDPAKIKIWLESVVKNWADSQRLKVEILRDKPGEYWRKFIVTIPFEILTPTLNV